MSTAARKLVGDGSYEIRDGKLLPVPEFFESLRKVVDGGGKAFERPVLVVEGTSVGIDQAPIGGTNLPLAGDADRSVCKACGFTGVFGECHGQSVAATVPLSPSAGDAA